MQTGIDFDRIRDRELNEHLDRKYGNDVPEPDLEPLPRFDAVMCEGALREIRGAKDALESGGQINYEEIAVGLVSDYGDTIIRALETMRENVRRAA